MCRSLTGALFFSGMVYASAACSVPVAAKEVVLWQGWMHIQPCQKLVTDNGFPYFKTGPQELHGTIKAEVPDSVEEAVVGVIAACAAGAVGVAGVTSIITSPAAAWPTFMAAFGTCAENPLGAFAAQLFDSMRIDQYTRCDW